MCRRYCRLIFKWRYKNRDQSSPLDFVPNLEVKSQSHVYDRAIYNRLAQYHFTEMSDKNKKWIKTCFVQPKMKNPNFNINRTYKLMSGSWRHHMRAKYLWCLDWNLPMADVIRYETDDGKTTWHCEGNFPVLGPGRQQWGRIRSHVPERANKIPPTSPIQRVPLCPWSFVEALQPAAQPWYNHWPPLGPLPESHVACKFFSCIAQNVNCTGQYSIPQLSCHNYVSLT